MPNAIVTGGSAGLGRALITELARAGWSVTTTARTAAPLADATGPLGEPVRSLAGDVADPQHREHLVRLAAEAGPIELLINNASELGGSPQPQLRDLAADTLTRILAV